MNKFVPYANLLKSFKTECRKPWAVNVYYKWNGKFHFSNVNNIT